MLDTSIPLWSLPLLSFAISFFTSMAGVSGAFLLLPFQVSVLGLASPSVSATNFLYNIIGCPGGIISYQRQGRMIWPLAWLIALTTLPGILLGYYLRLRFLPDPEMFKLFVGCVLLYLASRLLTGVRKGASRPESAGQNKQVSNLSHAGCTISYTFQGQQIRVNALLLGGYSLFIGIIGGIYGIGGGALIMPFCVSMLGLPVYTVAGATLFATFSASLCGVAIYSWLPIYNGLTAPPHWQLGLLLGGGGLVGMNLGARLQSRVPERLIKMILAIIILLVAGRYIMTGIGLI